MATSKDDKAQAEEPSAEEQSRRAMGKVPPSAGGSNSGEALVPEAGGDPDSVARVVKQLPKALQERVGYSTPEEVSAARAAYGEAVNAARNPQGPRATDGASDEEMAARTGQPIGDGKSTGAPSADDPGSGLREGKLTAGEVDGGRAAAAAQRQAAAVTEDAGTSRVSGRRASAARETTAQQKDSEEK